MMGNIKGSIHVDGKYMNCQIKNVLLCKDLKCNLFSIKRLEEAGFKIVFENKTVNVFKDGVMWLQGMRTGNLYEFSLNCYNNSNSSLTASKNQLNLWHLRLGHLNVSDVLKLSSIVDGIDSLKSEDKLFCESCVLGKQSRKPFKSVSHSKSSRCLQLIHSDVCGPITPTSWNGKRFILTFIDDYSHFTVVYLLSRKSEVFQYFKEYKSMVENMHNSKIASLRCDNGGEYSSSEFKMFCKTSGINIQYTISYTPEQNGTAERMNRTLMEKARSMIAYSGLLKSLWSEAILCANYLTNRSPTSATDKNMTPAEIWYNVKPNMVNIKVFGCIAYSQIPKIHRKKLDMKSEKLIMVGYGGNGYRLWNPKTQNMVFSRNVVFNEDSFMNKTSINRNEFNRKNQISTGIEIENIPSIQPCAGKEAPSNSCNERLSTSENIENVNSDSSEYEDFDEIEDREDQEQNADENLTQGSENPRIGRQKCKSNTEERCNTPLRRSSRQRKQPERLNYCAIALNAENFVCDVPKSFDDIEGRPDLKNWYKAVESELNSLKKNNTWTIVNLPPGKSIVDCKWVFKRKFDTNGNPGEYKARVVARGFSQQKGFDYEETYSPVARIGTLRVLLAVANKKNYHIHQMDVKTAFLNGNLREDIFMKIPQGLKNESNQVCKLNKALYGLKQAPRMWNERFNNYIQKLNFERSENDYCLYIRKHNGSVVYLLLYLDDFLLIGNDIKEIEIVKSLLMNEFEMKD